MTPQKSEEAIYLPGGVLSSLHDQPGRYLARGKGGVCWDQFGRRYIDFILGYGPVVLGHGNERIARAVSLQVQKGTLFPSYSELFVELAERLARLFPSTPRSLFMKTGSEAVAAALRLARAYTGRSKVIRCGFHGWHDQTMVQNLPWHTFEEEHKVGSTPAGVVADAAQRHILLWNGQKTRDLQEICEAHHDIAALLLDPVQVPQPFAANMKDIAEVTQKAGALLVLDESKTCFRVSLTGVQGVCNVSADITILSKAFGNGVPIAALVGPEAVIRLSRDCRIMGTYNNDLLGVAAAKETLAILEDPAAIPHLHDLGRSLIDGVNAILHEFDLNWTAEAVPYRWDCMPFIHFFRHSPGGESIKARFYRELTSRGVLMLPNHMNFICLEHTPEDIADALGVIRCAFASICSL